MTIRTQLLLVMLTALFLTTTIVCNVQIYTTYEQTRTTMENNLQNQANQIASQVDSWYRTITLSGQYFDSVYSPHASQQDLYRLLGAIYNSTDMFDNMILINSDGSVIAAYPFDAEISNMNFSNQDTYKAAAASLQPAISQLHSNTTTGKLVFTIAQPVLDTHGQLLVTLLQNIKQEALQDLLSHTKNDSPGQVLLFAANGQIVAPITPANTPDQKIPTEVFDLFRRDMQEINDFTDENGATQMFSISRIPTPGWGVAVIVNNHDLLRTLYNSIKYGFVTFCIIFIILAVVTSIIFNQLFRSITKITEQIAVMSEGDFSSAAIDQNLIKAAPRELKQLCMTFNRMAETIRQDITAREQTEEELRLARDELEARVELRTQDLLAMNEELHSTNLELFDALDHLKHTQSRLVQAEKMASLGSLVAGVAHEVNTPLGIGVTAASHLRQITQDILKLYEANTLKRQDFSLYLADAQEAAIIICSNLERAAQLISSFKQVSADRSTEVKRTFYIKQYLNEVLLSLHPRLKKTQHTLTVICEENLKIDSYPGAFAQIITNLIMNSLTHAYLPEDTGNIVIHVTVTSKSLQITYSDDGRGMAEDVRARIFDPFFTTYRSGGGTGLGMFVVYNIVTNQLAGTIECISQPNKGATFIIQIPLPKE